MIKSRPPRGGRLLPLVLFFLSPLVGEYLLGNTPISDVASLLLLAPLYGGGALLIREIARRTGRGWPTMLLFAAAYALLEEGPIDMMLWNPHYGGANMAVAYPGTSIPFLGTSGQLLQDTLAVHTIWSISVPIAITETLSRGPTRPWLGKKALTVVAVIFVLAAFLLSAAQIAELKFVAAPAELAWCAAAIVILIVLGFRKGHWQKPPRDTKAPRPWVVGAAAFTMTTLYWLRESLPVPRWAAVAAGCALFALSAILCARWSRSRRWDAAHRLALAGGALLTYVWLGILNSQALHISPFTMVFGDVVFGTGAVTVLILAARRILATSSWPQARPGVDAEEVGVRDIRSRHAR
jgi:hypothetical protein